METFLNDNWILAVNGRLTFAGVLNKYYGPISAGWRREQTRRQYGADYNSTILPALENVCGIKPIECLEQEDFEKAIEWIERRGRIDRSSEGMAYSNDTIQKFRFLMSIVLSIASDFQLCDNVLWGTRFEIEVKKNEAKENTIIRLKKSLTIREECRLFSFLFRNPNCKGQIIGVLLCAVFGLRDQEAAGAKWGDIKCMKYHNGVWELWVYTTVAPGGNELQSSGKTGNADRIIYIPPKVFNFLMERKKAIQAWLRENNLSDDISAYPIACFEDKFSCFCKSEQIAKQAKAIFREIGIEGKVLSALDAELNSGEYDSLIKRRVIEKDPTLYLLRRNFATHLYLLLSDDEIRYIIGHDFSEKSIMKRNDFADENRRFVICEKLAKRPVYGAVENWSATISEKEYTKTIMGSGETTYAVEIKPHSTVTVEISKKEVFDSLTVSGFSIPPKAVMKHDLSFDDSSPQIDILKAYNHQYLKEQEKMST